MQRQLEACVMKNREPDSVNVKTKQKFLCQEVKMIMKKIIQIGLVVIALILGGLFILTKLSRAQLPVDPVSKVVMHCGICQNLEKLVGSFMLITGLCVLATWIRPALSVIARVQDVPTGNRLQCCISQTIPGANSALQAQFGNIYNRAKLTEHFALKPPFELQISVSLTYKLKIRNLMYLKNSKRLVS